MINPAAPDGTPPRRMGKIHPDNLFVPPCLGEALRRATIANAKMTISKGDVKMRHQVRTGMLVIRTGSS